MTAFLSRLRMALSDPSSDGIHVASLFAGLFVGLLLLTLYAQTLSYQPVLPSALQDLLPWQFPGVHPEPWEAQLFHWGTIGVFAVTVIVWWFLSQIIARSFRTVQTAEATLWIVAIAIGAVWLFSLAKLHPQADWASLIPLQPAVWVLGAVVLALLLIQHRLPRIALPAMVALSLEILLVALFLGWLTYDPFSLSMTQTQALNSGDPDWFLTPVLDILHGKHLLVSSQSQYGFLLFYLLALPFSIAGLTMRHFNELLMALHFVYYALLYILLRAVLPKRWQAVIAFFTVLGFSYFSSEARFELYGQPSITRLRNFWDVPLFLCFAMEIRTRKRWWFAVGAALTGVAALYNMDIGISLFLTALVFAVSVPILAAGRRPAAVHENHDTQGGGFSRPTIGQDGRATRGQTSKAIVLRVSAVILSVAIVWAVLSLYIKAQSGSFPAWSHLFDYVRLYSAGYGALPMPVVGAYWWVLAVYAASLLIVLFHFASERSWRDSPLVVSLTIYGLLTFHYYLGRSFIANLWTVTLPAGLCAVLLWKHYANRLEQRIFADPLTRWWIRWTIMAIVALFVADALWTDVTVAKQMVDRRYIHPPPDTIDVEGQAALRQSVAAIQAHIPAYGRVAIISHRDSMYTRTADRPLAFDVPLLYSIFTKTELKRSLLTFFQENHRYLFVEHTPDNCHVCDAITPFLKQFYTFQTTEGFLDIYERNSQPAPADITF